MNRIIPFLLFCTLLFIITCGKNGSPTSPNETLDRWTYSYSVSGDTIFIKDLPIIDTSIFCQNDTLITSIDTEHLGLDTLMIVNDSLLMWPGDGAFHRIGTGSGIQGKWIWASDTLQYGYPYYGAIFQIGPSLITCSISGADGFLTFPWILRNPAPDISIIKASFYTIFLTGNITGEVATITWNDAGDETYASNNKQHTQTIYYKKPKSCPNDRPAWYYQFLNANTH
jgi:hypothetical protein